MTKKECDTKCATDKFWYVFCPNQKEVGGMDMDGESYECLKCDRRWYLDYDEMR